MIVGAGYDDIDVHAAKRYGITVSFHHYRLSSLNEEAETKSLPNRTDQSPQVTHTPSAVDDATATTTIYLILSSFRQFARAEIACRAGEWKKNLPLARDPEGKTLGIVGLGGIGSVVAKRLGLGWGMKVIYHNRKRLPIEKEQELGVEVEYKESLEGLLSEADVVSVHIPVSCGDICIGTRLWSETTFERWDCEES